MEWKCIFVLFFFLIIRLQSVRCEEEPKVLTETFDVRPGGESHKVEKALGSFKCKFVYVAQGGTNEEWDIILSKDEFGAYSCTVVRPGGTSYIFFQQFKMKIAGARLTSVRAAGSQDVPLEPDEYVVSKHHNEVRSKKDVFKSILRELTVNAEPKSEL
ncbi:myeloid-derived growth factor-like [Lytechinus pictus]|uniref:myeloid-derived growth factor-like n=1 Tax=Lytechinus pictus TaxID=7653 RepID=UPI00240D56C9|nr:myeloid-derived growth factor-like [Lytechinus pictus]